MLSTFVLLIACSALQGEYDENEVDPYHGRQEKQPEAEALELDHELNLGHEEMDEEDNEEEEEGRSRNG